MVDLNSVEYLQIRIEKDKVWINGPEKCLFRAYNVGQISVEDNRSKETLNQKQIQGHCPKCKKNEIQIKSDTTGFKITVSCLACKYEGQVKDFCTEEEYNNIPKIFLKELYGENYFD